MHVFQPISINDVMEGPFTFSPDHKMLISSGSKDKVNATTASWASVGFLWDKHVITIYLREERYTRELLESSEYFSLSFLDLVEFKRELKFMGMVSGRDEDKIKGARLTINHDEDTQAPFIDEASNVIICRKLVTQKLEPESYNDKSILDEHYQKGGYHIMFIGEIEKIMIR
ncbi:MAG: flavin reductase [Butyrivibrio sp.]|uniref:flavin reductase family protein n=1 Tax=Butyrivibrio sp. TaxID=28121 RepID=UPI0025F862A6|nr:flavin reductase [Butyrivibrio sp.]MCR5773205.1 flavin reductase [Butyrivibrio sp.]